MNRIAQNPREKILTYHGLLHHLQDFGVGGNFQGSLHQLALDQATHAVQRWAHQMVVHI